jgi:ubiquinone/menaquinone biosynthesis C-methylase UbiE
MSREQLRQAWNDWGSVDPLWAILTSPSHQFGRWDLAEFFQSGEADVDRVMSWAQRLGFPKDRRAALDFGCGVGRLTRALAKHFDDCYGVDIADTMIASAKELNTAFGSCRFMVNETDDLRQFADGSFDLVYSHLVLQHLPNQAMIVDFIAEFVRVLRPSGALLVFQLPSYIPPEPSGRHARTRRLLRTVGLTRRTTGQALRALGVSRRFAYERLGWRPEMRMGHLPKADIVALLERCGASVLDIEVDTFEPGNIESRTYYVTKDHETAGPS